MEPALSPMLESRWKPASAQRPRASEPALQPSAERPQRGSSARRCSSPAVSSGRQVRSGTRSRVVASCTGAFAVLPTELLEAVLSRCGAEELAALASTSRCDARRRGLRFRAELRIAYWAFSGMVTRVAAALLRGTAHGRRLASLFDSSGASPLRLLCFEQRCAAAVRAAGLLSLGSYHTAALLRSPAGGPPRLHTFGRGFHGQLGRGGYDNAAAPTPVAVPLDATQLTAVSCGSSHCAVLCADGSLWTWGLASSGELGHSGWTPIEVDVPRCVAALAGKVRVRAVVTGANHTLAVGECGGLWACGRGRCGQLGNGSFNDTGPLLRVATLRGVPVVAAAAGGSHSLALTAAGDVWSFGDARDGRLGQGDAVVAAAAWEPGAPVPARMRLPDWCAADPVVDVAAGGHHSLLRTASGRVLACGRGRHGAMGLGDADDRHAPAELFLPCADAGCACRLGASRGGRAVAMAAGRDHTVVLTACGAVYCCGFNAHGQLGTGCTSGSHALVRPALPRGVRIVAVAAGEGHTAAVGADGALFLWGRGDWGQLGSGSYRSRWTPLPLSAFSLRAE